MEGDRECETDQDEERREVKEMCPAEDVSARVALIDGAYDGVISASRVDLMRNRVEAWTGGSRGTP